MSGWSIRQRLVLTVLIVASVMVAATVFISLQTNAETIRLQTEATLSTQSQGYAQSLSEQLRGLQAAPWMLAQMLSDPTLSPIPDLWQTSSNLMRGQTLIERVNVLRPYRSGYQLVSFRRPAPGTELAPMYDDFYPAMPAEDWMQRTLAQRGVTWSSRVSIGGTTTAFRAAAPFSPGGQQTGIVWVELNARALRQQMQALQQSDTDGHYHILLAGNEVIGVFGAPSSMADRTGWTYNSEMILERLSGLLTGMREQGTEGVEAVDPLQDSRSAASFITLYPLSVPGWELVSIYSPDTLQSPQTQTALLVLLLALGGLLVLVVLVRNMVNQLVSQPLMEISTAAQEIGSGDMRYHITYTHRNDEVGALARALESMQLNLADTYGRLSLYGRTLEQRVAERTHELDQARELAQDNASELRALYDASVDLVSEYQLEVMLQKLVSYVRTLLRSGYCSVWLLNEDSRQLRLVATTPEHRHVVGVVITANEGLAGRVIRTRKPLIVDDYTNWPGRIGWIMPQMHRAVGVPLMYSGKAIGAVIAGRGALDRRFEESDQRLLNLLVNVVAPIVRNAQLFAQLDESKHKIELANEVKTRFLAGITHELRTPLNLVINNMDFMRIGVFGEINSEQHERLDQTIRSAEHLLYLINDLLDVSKIEAGEMQLFLQPTELYPVIVDTLDAAIATLPDESPIALMADFPDTLPMLNVDARRLRQVLFNLLSNAIKFTKQGEIWFRVKVHRDRVEFSVSDTGMGIPKEELDGIFHPFERSNRAKQLGIEGTGLGLPISRYLVEAHGGQLEVETEVGKGSCFRFSIALNLATNGHRKDTTTAVLSLSHPE